MLQDQLVRIPRTLRRNVTKLLSVALGAEESLVSLDSDSSCRTGRMGRGLTHTAPVHWSPCRSIVGWSVEGKRRAEWKGEVVFIDGSSSLLPGEAWKGQSPIRFIFLSPQYF